MCTHTRVNANICAAAAQTLKLHLHAESHLCNMHIHSLSMFYLFTSQLNMGADSSEGEVASAVGEVVEQLGQMGVRLAEDVQVCVCLVALLVWLFS